VPHDYRKPRRQQWVEPARIALRVAGSPDTPIGVALAEIAEILLDCTP